MLVDRPQQLPSLLRFLGIPPCSEKWRRASFYPTVKNDFLGEKISRWLECWRNLTVENSLWLTIYQIRLLEDHDLASNFEAILAQPLFSWHIQDLNLSHSSSQVIVLSFTSNHTTPFTLMKELLPTWDLWRPVTYNGIKKSYFNLVQQLILFPCLGGRVIPMFCPIILGFSSRCATVERHKCSWILSINSIWVGGFDVF